MTVLTVHADQPPHEAGTPITDRGEIVARLAAIGVGLEQWSADRPLPPRASDAEILAAYAPQIEALKARGGYRSVDVVRLTPEHPNREAMRTKFLAEHVHDDDEVRFFVEGAGMFFIRASGQVHALECGVGDLIVLPRGTTHWFDTGARPYFTAIRLFTTAGGWVARFTGDPIAERIPLYAGAA
jgi:1,2-dihydroxy-3-keto-5-methylthiopentene dioxygenase